jgi:hypothetical protein
VFGAPAMGAFHMISNKPSPPINLDLVDQVCKHIPIQSWSLVKEQLIDAIVDAMPTHILEKLTVIQLVMPVLLKFLMIITSLMNTIKI